MANKPAVIQNMSKLVVAHGETMKNFGITPQTLTTIAVAQRVRALKAEKAAIEAEKKEASTEIEATRNRIVKLVEAAGAAEAEKRTELYKAFAAAVGIKAPKVSTSNNLNSVNGKHIINVHVTYDHDGCGSISTSVDVKAPKELLSEIAKLDKARVDAADIGTRMVNVRVELQNIGDLERDVNAAMAHKILSSTDEGQALLKDLNLSDM